MIRPLKDNGGCGSKLITFPKEVLSLAGFENVETVIVEVKKGEIILRKEKKNDYLFRGLASCNCGYIVRFGI